MSEFKPLALRVPHQPDEPPHYYASRLAARNKRSARTFARDLGMEIQRLSDGDELDIRKLADLGAADANALIGTGLRRSQSGYLLKDQELQKFSVRRSRIHVCAACLLEDVDRSDLPPHLAVYGRTHWMLASIRTCPIHNHALVEIPRESRYEDRHDWTTNVTPIIPRLSQLVDSAVRRPASSLEVYLIDRLHRRPSTSWLNAFPFYAAELVAELIGAVVVFGKSVSLDTLSDDARYEAGGAGASLANAGPERSIPN